MSGTGTVLGTEEASKTQAVPHGPYNLEIMSSSIYKGMFHSNKVSHQTSPFILIV